LRYRSEIDGLRAIAVVPVILFHAGFSGFSGGYIGVDVFFVISGYLITGVILEEQAQGKFSFLHFYERRARRILPALTLVTAACVPAALLLMFPYLLEEFGRSLIAVWLFASNILFWRESGYFNPAAEEKPLLHTWSLGVEEQYYLFFPAFIVLFAFMGRRRLSQLIIVLAIGSLLLAEWGWRNSPNANFYLLPTRAWELFIGALLAFLISKRSNHLLPVKWGREALAAAGILLIAYSIGAFDSETPFPSLWALVPTAGAALVIAFATIDTLAGRLLSSRPLVVIGLLSYSLYLWHQPLFAFARVRGEPTVAIYWTLIAGTGLLSWLSWRYVETPMRNRSFLTQRTVFGASFAATLIFVAIGAALVVADGFPSRLSSEQKKLLSWQSYPRGQFYREGACFLRDNRPHTDFSPTCLIDSASSGSDIVIWGDSHAAHLYPGLASHGAPVSQFTTGGCPPVLNYAIGNLPNCKNTNDYVFSKIEARASGTVILAANWRAYFSRAAFREALDAELRRFSAMNVRFVLIGPAPQWPPTLPQTAARHSSNGRFPAYMRAGGLPEVRQIEAKLRAVASKHNIQYVSLLDHLCKHEQCRAAADDSGNVPMSWDRAHLTKQGSEIVADLLLGEIRPEFIRKESVN
jgi:peptidoglycan/LPS O-acetylase OafA/YrhL